MAKKEVKKEKTKTQRKDKPAKGSKKTKSKKGKDAPPADDGLVIIDEQIEEDKEAELEARKAYLEEARSQEVDD
ncbi:MAG TPA: hypothetical protein VNK44_01830 [Candidatus Nitrosotenuis sp.]|nr:hypothetical protein [Candidatus Nitrosotenuis sp.]